MRWRGVFRPLFVMALSTMMPLTAEASSRQPTGEDIVCYAERFIGVPYVWGGQTTHGIDCSGLVQTVYGHFHIALPRTSSEQAGVGAVVSKESLQPGYLVFFNTTGDKDSHVGIYVGHGEFISATSSKGVRICKINNPQYWGPRFTFATNPFTE